MLSKKQLDTAVVLAIAETDQIMRDFREAFYGGSEIEELLELPDGEKIPTEEGLQQPIIPGEQYIR